MKALKIALVATVALAAAAPALAQYQSPYQPTEQYQRDQDQYRNAQDNYRADRADYDRRRADYDRARADYQARRDHYEAERARYDERYGYGAYARVYGPAPVWNQAYWDAQYAPAPAAGSYGRDTAYVDPCRHTEKNDQVAGGLIGALAGAALGSNVAASGRHTEGAVLGGVVGGLAGASIGRSAGKSHCDSVGYYYNYNDTVAYRESGWDRDHGSGEHDYAWYREHNCRLAPERVDRTGDTRYIRVCPDADGRYRVAG
jgi:hypothetical protein